MLINRPHRHGKAWKWERRFLAEICYHDLPQNRVTVFHNPKCYIAEIETASYGNHKHVITNDYSLYALLNEARSFIETGREWEEIPFDDPYGDYLDEQRAWYDDSSAYAG